MHPKNAEMVHSQRGHWKFVYHTNAQGHRGPFISPAATSQSTNVVVLGDSFTFGCGVNDHEVYVQVMSEELGSRFCVINGGISGWGIDSEIKWYFTTGQLYKPKYVVLQFAANDPSESFTGVTTVENGEFKFHPYPFPKPAWQRFLSRSSIIQNSHLYSALRGLHDRVAGDGGERSARACAGDRIKREQENYVEMLGLFAEQLKAQGIRLLIVSVTHKHEDLYRYDLERFPQIKEEIERLRVAGSLHFVDLPLERMATLPGSPEGHQWSAAHHEIVGKEIDAKILELEAISELPQTDHVQATYRNAP